VSTAFLLSSIPLLVVEGAAAKNTSEATGISTVIQTASSGIGTSVSAAILGAFAVQIAAGFAPSSEMGYIIIFALTAVLTGIALVAALFLKRKPSSAADEADDAASGDIDVPILVH
jgi:heme/copper-type cytochrome/quinol oxidase subunit 4